MRPGGMHFDRYAAIHRAMAAQYAAELPAIDPIEQGAVETAARIDVVIDEMAADCARFEKTDDHGLHR